MSESHYLDNAFNILGEIDSGLDALDDFFVEMSVGAQNHGHRPIRLEVFHRLVQLRRDLVEVLPIFASIAGTHLSPAGAAELDQRLQQYSKEQNRDAQELHQAAATVSYQPPAASLQAPTQAPQQAQPKPVAPPQPVSQQDLQWLAQRQKERMADIQDTMAYHKKMAASAQKIAASRQAAQEKIHRMRMGAWDGRKP